MELSGTEHRAGKEPRVSVIVPAVDEAVTLAATLASLRSEALPFEVIVVDAQSSDATAAITEAAGAQVISCRRRQRAHQLNLGARQARGAVLLFVHADTLLPPGALDHVAQALRDGNVVGGAFTRRYASPSLVLRATCALARGRNRTIGWHLGDQAMFVRSSVFFQLGGFRDVQMFEDLDFSRRLKRVGRVVTLRPGVISSARRFEDGPARTTLRDFRLTLGYLLNGLPPTDQRANRRRAPLVPATKSRPATVKRAAS